MGLSGLSHLKMAFTTSAAQAGPSSSLRLGNKELLHTTQFQTALYTASGERREMGIVPSCLVRIVLSSVWFEGNEISVACACVRIGRACNGPAATLEHRSVT